jgi:hypothetical protein
MDLLSQIALAAAQTQVTPAEGRDQDQTNNIGEGTAKGLLADRKMSMG